MSLKINSNNINCKKEDFEDAFNFLHINKENLDNSEFDNKLLLEWDSVKKIIHHILKFSQEFNISPKDEYLKEELINSLLNKWKFEYFWLAKKIQEILNPTNCESCFKNESIWINRILEKDDSFIPFYQWIRDNKTWEIKKYEALVRYIDGNNIISPFEFIEIAKKNNLLWIISMKMITKVIKEMWIHKYDISLNLDWELSNNYIIDFLFDNLEKNKIDPSRLTIEILETINWTNIEEYNKMVSNIKKMKSKWIHISIDDYGSWNSTLLRILDTDPEFIKIDWDLIKKLENEYDFEKTIVILKSIISMTHQLWKKVIAEHIENKNIQNILTELEADYSQWFYYDKPSRNIIKNN